MWVLAVALFIVWALALVVGLAGAYCNRRDRLDAYEDDALDEDEVITERLTKWEELRRRSE